MAKKVIVTMVDDYDGQSEAHETVTFSMNGVNYEMDLSMLNASKLEGVLEPWITKARKIGHSRGARPKRGAQAGARSQTTAVREWAMRNGLKVAPRGRIAAHVELAYAAAHKN